MPKFTEQEKAAIRKNLLTKSKDLFSRYGLAKTSIDDIVLRCGIAKGSFYKFFDSKEELYYAILQEEENARDELLGELLRKDLQPKELLIAFFRRSLEIVDENPFLRQVFLSGDYERMIRKLPEYVVESGTQEHVREGRFVVEGLIGRGIIREDSPEVVTGIIQAVLMLRLFQDKIGKDLFPSVMDRIVEYVAEGLTRSEPSS